ncbi:hypothetical protein HYPSUDRAFT_216288 [Hypholoma sublateritium FD-334 SS-4]|uniref:Uncharacterized protein n=1 Tax=Hypholoma sublateritium (strain FD-334 SS-4) TaxID=945553 RepID=A0A0D2PNU8_HYPSF|nr:hypothetical protein HYPSUDRAFT_216288 [Hypholoma sublateritium FD-334 SS-4]
MVSIKYSFVFLLSTASVVLATLAQIELQLGFVSSNSTNLDNLLNAFPTTGASVAEALAIHSAAVSFSASLSTMATITTENGPLLSQSVDASTLIFDDVLMCGNNLQNALFEIVVKKPSFTALPIGGLPALVLNDLDNLNASSIAFADSFIAVAPESLLPNATALKATVLSEFATAIAAYS